MRGVKKFHVASEVSEVAIAATDGPDNPNPGPGGWGVFLIGNGKIECVQVVLPRLRTIKWN
jgi:ribonuclease HI